MKKKKISKHLKDLKIAMHEKENIWVLQNGDDKIIWLIGIRMDERFKVIDAHNTNFIIQKQEL